MNAKEVVQEIEQALEKNVYSARHVIPKILERHDAGIWSPDGELSLLHAAARHCSVQTVEWLLKEVDCRRNAKDADGLTPLDHAAQTDREDIVQFLLTDPHPNPYGPLNYRNYDREGKSTADCAQEAGAEKTPALLRAHAQKKTLKALQAADPQDGLADAQGWTALHWATEKRDYTAMERLLAVGADPDQRNDKGESAVWVAIRNRDPKGFELFRRNGLRLLQRNDKDQTLAHAAAEAGRVDILEKLAEIRKEQVPYRLELPLINHQDHKGRTPAHVAAMRGGKKSVDVARKLIELGAELMIDTIDAFGETPVEAAFEHGNAAVAAVFLEAIPDKDLQHVWSKYLSYVTSPDLYESQGHGVAIAERLLAAYRSFPEDSHWTAKLKRLAEQAKERIHTNFEKGNDREVGDAEAVLERIEQALSEPAAMPAP